MAKGDKKKMQNVADTQVATAQNNLNTINSSLANQSAQANTDYRSSLDTANQDYRSIMDQYRNFQATTPDRVNFDPLKYNRTAELGSAMSGYQNFADTGGYSQDDITNMRARGISPIRAVYANALNEMNRQKNLSGGYSPNFNAAAAKMARSSSGQIADSVQDVNARLAEAINQGKLAGLGGLGNLSVADSQMANQMAMANADNQLRAGQINATSVDPMRLAAIQGQQSLYGTTPGMAGMFADQVNASNAARLNAQGSQLGIGNMALGGQQQVAALPSDFQVAAGRVKKGAELAGRGVAAVATGGASEAALFAARGGKFQL